MIYETIYGQVISKANNYLPVADTTFGRRLIKTQRLRDYERSFDQQCKIYRGRNISKPFIFHATIYESTNSYDIDNGVKTVLDCLQYVGAVTDDNLCMEMHVRKVVDPLHPRVTYAIQETEPTLF